MLQGLNIVERKKKNEATRNLYIFLMERILLTSWGNG